MLGKLEGIAIMLNDGFLYAPKKEEYKTISSWLRDDNLDALADMIENKKDAINLIAVKYSNNIKNGKRYKNFLERINEQMEKNYIQVVEEFVETEYIDNVYNNCGLRDSSPSRSVLYISFKPEDGEDYNGLSVKSFKMANYLEWFSIKTTDYGVKDIVR